MQFDGFGIGLGRFGEGLDGLVRLLIQEEFRPLK